MRSKIKSKTNLDNWLYDISFRNYIDCVYEEEHDCENYGCNDDCACRCGKVTEERIDNFDLCSVESCISNYVRNNTKRLFEGYKVTDIGGYCIERILRINRIDEDSFDINISGGYYGEEIESVKIQRNDKLLNDLNNFLKLKTDSEKIEFVLDMEYGDVLEVVKNRNWKIKNIKKNKINLGNKSHAKKSK